MVSNLISQINMKNKSPDLQWFFIFDNFHGCIQASNVTPLNVELGIYAQNWIISMKGFILWSNRILVFLFFICSLSCSCFHLYYLLFHSSPPTCVNSMVCILLHFSSNDYSHIKNIFTYIYIYKCEYKYIYGKVSLFCLQKLDHITNFPFFYQ